MATDTQERTETEEGTEEFLTIVVDGKEVRIPKDSRLVRMIENAEAEERAKRYAGERELVLSAVQQVAFEQSEGYEEAMDGMSIILDFGEDEARLVPSNLIQLRQRPPRRS